MEPPVLTPVQRAQLIRGVARALDEMIETSCIEMAPLWLQATRLARRDLQIDHGSLGFKPSQRYLALSRGAQSRYRYLATWRHAVIFVGLARLVVDDDYRAITALVYFTPYPKNTPPYAWSNKVTAAPNVPTGLSPSTLKKYAKEGCWTSVRALRLHIREIERDTSVYAEILGKLLRTGCRDTVREVLKLERSLGFPEWEPI